MESPGIPLATCFHSGVIAHQTMIFYGMCVANGFGCRSIARAQADPPYPAFPREAANQRLHTFVDFFIHENILAAATHRPHRKPPRGTPTRAPPISGILALTAYTTNNYRTAWFFAAFLVARSQL